MIDSSTYISKVEEYFSFLNTEFEFQISDETVVGGAYYDVQYKDATRVVSISYENTEDYLLVILYFLVNNQLPDYDDKTKTLHLEAINKMVFSKVSKLDIISNGKYFAVFTTSSKLESKLLKSAKELRLFMRYYKLL